MRCDVGTRYLAVSTGQKTRVGSVTIDHFFQKSIYYVISANGFRAADSSSDWVTRWRLLRKKTGSMKAKQKLDEKALKENELISWSEKQLGSLQPYWQQIVLAIALGFLAFIAIAYFVENKASREAAKWQDLSTSIWNSENTNDISDLTYFAQEYPNDTAGLWALQLAADYELRSGIRQFTDDRKAGLDKVKKAVGLYQQVVDSNAKKTTMLQRRSVFGLAYAAESSGDFETARKYYQQIVDEGEKGPFFEAANRGRQRSTSDAYVAIFNKFRDWEDASGIAPGPVLPSRPNINFPDIDDLSPGSGGEFGAAGSGNIQKPATTAIPASSATDQSNGDDRSANENKDEKEDDQAGIPAAEPGDTGDESGDANTEEKPSENESGGGG